MMRSSSGFVQGRSDAGAGLVEVVIATMVFMFGFQAAMLGFGSATERQRDADLRQSAAMLATQVLHRLQAVGDSSCAGVGSAHPLTMDRDPSNGLDCLGTFTQTAAGGQCAVDHPVDVSELDAVLQSQRSGARNVYRASVDAVAGPVAWVGARGPYRVTWNAQCVLVSVVGGATARALKRIQVNVAWPPFNSAFAEGRVIRMSYTAAPTNS